MQRELVLNNLFAPTHLINHPFTNDLYITDQPGYIYRVTSNENQLWLDISSLIIPLLPEYDESGLLSIAFSSNADQLFLFSSRPVDQIPEDVPFFIPKDIDVTSEDIHVDIISMIPIIEGEPSIDEEMIYLGILRDSRIHHGGKLLYHNNYLYITTGDMGPQKDPYNRAQDLNCILGKILRIIPDESGYTIPKDNPFLKSNIPEIYAYGFRNPWSLTLSQDGRIFVADVGYESREEVDLLKKGINYGWNIKEGIYFTPWSTPQQRLQLKAEDPIFDYPHRIDGMSSVMGGYYLSGSKRYLDGYYLADIIGPIMRISQPSRNSKDSRWLLADQWKIQEEGDDYLRIYGWGYDGEYLYLLMSNNNASKGQQGYIERILSLS